MISLEFLLASGIGLLVSTGVYLILRARTFPVVLGLAMIGYAVNLFLFAMGRLQLNSPAILKEATQITDPLPRLLLLCNLPCVAVMKQEQTMWMQKKIPF